MEPRKRICTIRKEASIAMQPLGWHRKVRIIGNTFAGRVKLVVDCRVGPTRLPTACSKVIGQKIDKKLRQVPFLSARQKSWNKRKGDVVCLMEAIWAPKNPLEP